MKCVFCGGLDSRVVDSRYLRDSSIRRRRECCACGKRFTTYETVETNPMIVTNVFQEREAFKIEKLKESLRYATYCQNVSDIDALAESIETSLLGLDRQEITTFDIVEVAMGKLSEVDMMSALVYYVQHTGCNTYADVERFIKG